MFVQTGNATANHHFDNPDRRDAMHRVSTMMHRVSTMMHRVSTMTHRVSTMTHRVSTMTDRVSPPNHPMTMAKQFVPGAAKLKFILRDCLSFNILINICQTK